MPVLGETEVVRFVLLLIERLEVELLLLVQFEPGIRASAVIAGEGVERLEVDGIGFVSGSFESSSAGPYPG